MSLQKASLTSALLASSQMRAQGSLKEGLHKIKSPLTCKKDKKHQAFDLIFICMEKECQSFLKPICAQCLHEEHSGHEIKLIKELAEIADGFVQSERNKKQVSLYWQQLEGQYKGLYTKITSLMEYLKEFQKTLKEVHERFFSKLNEEKDNFWQSLQQTSNMILQDKCIDEGDLEQKVRQIVYSVKMDDKAAPSYKCNVLHEETVLMVSDGYQQILQQIEDTEQFVQQQLQAEQIYQIYTAAQLNITEDTDYLHLTSALQTNISNNSPNIQGQLQTIDKDIFVVDDDEDLEEGEGASVGSENKLKNIQEEDDNGIIEIDEFDVISNEEKKDVTNFPTLSKKSEEDQKLKVIINATNDLKISQQMQQQQEDIKYKFRTNHSNSNNIPISQNPYKTTSTSINRSNNNLPLTALSQKESHPSYRFQFNESAEEDQPQYPYDVHSRDLHSEAFNYGQYFSKAANTKYSIGGGFNNPETLQPKSTASTMTGQQGFPLSLPRPIRPTPPPINLSNGVDLNRYKNSSINPFNEFAFSLPGQFQTRSKNETSLNNYPFSKQQ